MSFVLVDVHGRLLEASWHALRLLFVSDPAQRLQLNVERVQAEFSLSAREAQIACGLAAVFSLQEIAVRLGVSYHTTRTHLKGCFAKVRVHDQVGLCCVWPAACRDTAPR